MSDENETPNSGARAKPRGKPFNKGEDPRRNLSVRNKRVAERESIPAMCRMHAARMVEIAVSIAEDETARHRDRLKAAEIVLERGLGKADSTVKIEGSVHHSHALATIDVGLLTPEQCIALASAVTIRQPDPLMIEAEIRD